MGLITILAVGFTFSRNSSQRTGALSMGIGVYAAYQSITTELTPNPITNTLIMMAAVYVVSRGIESCLGALKTTSPYCPITRPDRLRWGCGHATRW